MIKRYLRHVNILAIFIFLTLIFPMSGSLASGLYNPGKACTCLTCITSCRNTDCERLSDMNETQTMTNGVEAYTLEQMADEGVSSIPDAILEPFSDVIKTPAEIGIEYVEILIIAKSVSTSQTSYRDRQCLQLCPNVCAYRNTQLIWIRRHDLCLENNSN